MTSLLPTPLAAAIGVVPAVLDGIRRLPGRAVQLPVLAISSALSTMDQLRRDYDGLADRGERLVGRLRGTAAQQVQQVTELGEEAEALLASTPFASATSSTPTIAPTTVATASTEAAVGTVAPLAGRVRKASPEAPKGVPTPKAVEPETTRVDSAAASEAVAVADAATAGTPVPLHDELPVPDYDHMTLGSLRGRLRALSVGQLAQVRAYEKAHADRLPVVTMLDNRIAKLAHDASATPTGNVSTAPAPEQAALAGGPAGPGISPATTTAPTTDRPSQGDPTNPAQPR